MKLTKEMLDYTASSMEEEQQLIRELCGIPAPSHHEEKRAEYCKAWFERNGFENVFIDEALNVIAPYHVTDDNEVVVFMAHTDTVFPDTEPMPFSEDEEKMYSPGVCDDTANLSSMLMAARYFVQNQLQPKYGIVFVANSCEEGLGNLKGSRAVVARYGKRMKALISFDGTTLNRIVTSAVGSHRYRVTVRTEGGHSYSAFGNRNAIRYLASMIDAIYAIKVPEKEGIKTTYNVGTVSGGTSVNTICQEATMLCEYRSNDRECLDIMRQRFEAIFAAFGTMADVEVELVGERPCAGDLDPTEYGALVALAEDTIRETVGREPIHGPSSTDCNIPLSVGIPSVCMSAAVGGKCHTRQEFTVKSELLSGCRLAMSMIGNYFA